MRTLYGLANELLPKVRRIGKETVWIGLGQVAIASGVLIGVRLLTEALQPAAYGELALAMTLATLLNQVLLGPLSGATMRFFAPSEESGQILAFIQGARRLLVQATLLIAAFAVIVISGLIVLKGFEWMVLAVLAFVFAMLSGYGSVLDGMQNAARQRVIVSWHGGLAIWLRYILAVVLVSYLGSTSSVAMLGYVIGTFIVLSSQYFFFRRQIFSLAAPSDHKDISKLVDKFTRQMRHYAWPFAAWGIFTWLQQASGRWALQLFANSKEVGLYAVVFQLGYYPGTLLSGMLMQLVAPILFARVGDGSDSGRLKHSSDLNRKLIWGTIVVTLLVSLVVTFLHQQIFALFAATEYQEVSWLLPIMFLSGGVFAAGQLASMPLLMGMQTKRMIAPKVGTAILGVFCSAIGAWLWEVKGVVMASLVFATVYFFWMYRLDNTR